MGDSLRTQHEYWTNKDATISVSTIFKQSSPKNYGGNKRSISIASIIHIEHERIINKNETLLKKCSKQSDHKKLLSHSVSSTSSASLQQFLLLRRSSSAPHICGAHLNGGPHVKALGLKLEWKKWSYPHVGTRRKWRTTTRSQDILYPKDNSEDSTFGKRKPPRPSSLVAPVGDGEGTLATSRQAPSLLLLPLLAAAKQRRRAKPGR
jgi:hypothetical protein